MPYFEPGSKENRMRRGELTEAAGDGAIVFYCTGFMRAYHAAVQAVNWGLPPDRVYWYKGGYLDWAVKIGNRKSGSPVEKENRMKKIQVLGMGCAKCNNLYAAAEKAAKELGVEYEMEKISDIDKITDMGVMMTPALAVDGEVKSSGRIPSPEELKKFISGGK
jgi:small redox-active disulfide protein 2